MNKSIALKILLSVFAGFFFLSCEMEAAVPVEFDVQGTNSILYAKSLMSQEGLLDFARPGRFDYRFDNYFYVPPNSSLQIEYQITNFFVNPVEFYIPVLNTGRTAWQLPMDFGGIISYSIPINDNFNGHFSIELYNEENFEISRSPVIKIHSIKLIERFFGFYKGSEDYVIVTPFVFKFENGVYEINVPDNYWPRHLLFGINSAFSNNGLLEFPGRKVESVDGNTHINFPPIQSSASGRAKLSGNNIESFWIYFRDKPLGFPAPIIADPGYILTWQMEKWRDPRFEVFGWDRFTARGQYPLILIFDFVDYDMQDRMFKRLAFFVEKAGFRGRLAFDNEIHDLHGWNAHDYRAEDLARFFDTARKTNFPLLNEEWELESILKNNGIIYEELGNIKPGLGAVVSVSREAPAYMRQRFLVHESFHGIFFIDEDFYKFSRQRWENFSSVGKRFIISYFDEQGYDTQDEFILIKEFKAHLLQQPLSQVPDYFGRNLPLRLVGLGRRSDLPRADTNNSNYWSSLADLFSAEAEVFSDYVYSRWGFEAGRVWNVQARN